jgi:cellulose synthase/poly-beta-1,6-N-acetylglucosamine synthase-like glycosyltransferase
MSGLVDLGLHLVIAFNYFVLFYFLAMNTAYGLLLLRSFFGMLSHLREWTGAVEGSDELLTSDLTLPISIIAPAYNEEKTVVQSVRALLSLHYPAYEVILVNDGSKDGTLAALVEQFDMYEIFQAVKRDLDSKPVRGIYASRLHENLVVVDKENGGKSDALNAGINVATSPLVCVIDADTLIEPDALLRIARPFLTDPEHTLAVGGTIRIANGCEVDRGRIVRVGLARSRLAVFQVVEYLRAFLFGRLSWNYFGGNLIISGALGLFRKASIVQVGGYATDTVGEDMEVVARLHRWHHEHKVPYAIRFIPDPIAWTEAPESARVLSRQRDRWQRGLLDTLTRHARMILNPRYGWVGMFGMPFFVFVEAMAPVVEIFGLGIFIASVAAGVVDYWFAGVFLLIAFGLGVLLSVTSLVLEEISFHRYPRAQDVWRLVLFAVLENFGYRQMTSWWRLKGLWGFLRGKKQWGRMERKGFAAAPQKR